MSLSEHIKGQILTHLPQKPGVYQYYDKNSRLLYVGKAKNIKRRVSSYFSKKTKNKKTQLLISNVFDIKYVVVKTEMDALLLENNLIKKHQPKYNVLLKDSKTYPWICIKKEPFPRVFQTRKIIPDGSDYYGPYTSVRLVKTLLDFFHNLYPLRTCSFNLSKKNISNKKFSLCLEYHLGNCLGPCVGKETNNDYLININHIKKIIAGDVRSVIESLKNSMSLFSKKLEYEKALQIKNRIELLKNYQSKSTIVNTKITDVDVFSIISDCDSGFINYLKIINGAIIQSHTVELKKRLNETDEELLRFAIFEIRQRFNSTSKEIFCSLPIESPYKKMRFSVPKIGDKKRLIDLSIQNAKHIQKEKGKSNYIKKIKNPIVLTELKKVLKLEKVPVYIEGFDNSNLQGSSPVGACVVFKNGKPIKKEYRIFNIKNVSGQDDFASMKEVVFRRYLRLLKEQKELPQLIIIDGGKGQLNSALLGLKKLGLEGKIAIIGIAKKLEKIYFPKDSDPLYLDMRSESLKLIQRVRNESHRFSLYHHKKKRENRLFISSIEQIKGIGPKTSTLLISHFGSVKKVFSANKKELKKFVGEKKASLLIKSSLLEN